MDSTDKRFVYIVSSMRSGSTLLKALIATRPDASDLPETSFRHAGIHLSNKKIIVIKKPAWFNDVIYPPALPGSCKKIVLIREPYDTISSIRKMNVMMGQQDPLFFDWGYLVSYWISVYEKIIQTKLNYDENTLVVRYEDLVNSPKEETSKVFKFVGSVSTKGTNVYSYPKTYAWRWGKDDGGEIIKSLRVQPNIVDRSDERLLNLLNGNRAVQTIKRYFGYDQPLI